MSYVFNESTCRDASGTQLPRMATRPRGFFDSAFQFLGSCGACQVEVAHLPDRILCCLSRKVTLQALLVTQSLEFGLSALGVDALRRIVRSQLAQGVVTSQAHPINPGESPQREIALRKWNYSNTSLRSITACPFTATRSSASPTERAPLSPCNASDCTIASLQHLVSRFPYSFTIMPHALHHLSARRGLPR